MVFDKVRKDAENVEKSQVIMNWYRTSKYVVSVELKLILNIKRDR